jgi:nucleoside diphosphate-linked moiety X motif 19, mitochondrial
MDDGRDLGGIVPLNFFPDTDSSTDAEQANNSSVTPVEEEARGLQGRNYTWDKKTPSSEKRGSTVMTSSPAFVSYTEPPFTQSADGTIRANLRAMATAIEPRPMPSAGATVSIPTRNASGEWERDESGDGEEPFTFPLCLPGDSDQSRAQADLAGLDFSAGTAGKAGGKAALNRVFVSPRTKKDGGGLVVRGIQRQGVASLRDFKYGTAIERLPPDGEQDSKSRL